MSNYEIRIEGNVQGVGYRYAAYQKANILGVKGTVQNLDDGSVVIKAKADEDQIQNFIKWCHVGPDAAKVEVVTAQPLDQLDADRFRIQR